MAARIVLDTNVAASALLWGGTPYRLIQAAAEGHLTLYTSPRLFAELRGVLARPHLIARLERLHVSIERALALYEALAIAVTPVAVSAVVLSDPDDDHVVAAAIAAQAELIVSGDRHLLDLGHHEAIRIVSAADALSLVGMPIPTP